jgi:hypothetical protein
LVAVVAVIVPVVIKVIKVVAMNGKHLGKGECMKMLPLPGF